MIMIITTTVIVILIQLIFKSYRDVNEMVLDHFIGNVPNVTMCITDLFLLSWEQGQILLLTSKYTHSLPNFEIPHLKHQRS